VLIKTPDFSWGQGRVLKKRWSQTKLVVKKTIYVYRMTPEPIRMAFGLMLFVALLLEAQTKIWFLFALS
jgi:hypothetical protein